MKTVKKITIAVALIATGILTISLSKANVKDISSCLKDSTHQGYRSMVSDYIF
ncbi:MAG: hypothetical protein K0S33_1274 [Bacteroidetes bacterium]|jgi:hypothetical protein|nr:hypothetical protein [Bacteroidota bacterium]